MQRPTSVTVFGILNIAFACFGVLGILASIALFNLPASSGNPVVKIMQDNPTYAAFMKISILLGIFSSLAMLAAGIGLLMLKGWGRYLSIGYAIYAILFGIVGVVMNFLFLVRPLLERASQQQGPEAAGAIGGAIGGSFGGCFGLIYPILLLIFMLRPRVVAAFQQPPYPQNPGFPPR